MSDFSPDDLMEAINRAILSLLNQNGIAEPPVDAVALVQDAFNYTVREAEPEPDEERGRFGARPPRRRGREIVLQLEQSDESRNFQCARACARELVPQILSKLGVAPGTENKSGANQLVGLIAPRLLLPGRWFERDARKSGFDLWAMKDRYSTAGYELIAMRFLDIDEPCVMAVVDDGEVSSRRGNRMPAGKKLTVAEQRCLERIQEQGEPQTVRAEEWTVKGWPVPTGPFNRIILRAVPDEL